MLVNLQETYNANKQRLERHFPEPEVRRLYHLEHSCLLCWYTFLVVYLDVSP